MDNAMFQELLESVKQMDSIVKGVAKPSRVFEHPSQDIHAIRERLKLSQDKFAILLGVSKRTIENWEQGRRRPVGAAKSLLRIIEADPELALRALSR